MTASVPPARALREHASLPTLCRLWAKVLGRPGIDADEHFFLAGGDSIQLGILLVKVEQVFAVRLPLARLAEYTTPRKMLQCLLQTHAPCQQAEPEQVNAITTFPASWTQHGLWLSELQADNCGLYNRAVLLTLQGDVSLPALRAAVNAVRQRFPLLRASLQPELQTRSLQVRVSACHSLDLPLEPCGDPLLAARREVATPFEMSLSLWRFRLLQTDAGEYSLLVCAHHSACDGWSGAVFLQSLAQAYLAFSAGAFSQAPGADDAFPRHCLQQSQHATSQQQVINLHWWRAYLAGADSLCSRWMSRNFSQWPYGVDRVQLQVERESWVALLRYAAQRGVTVFAVLAAALGKVLCAFMEQQECVVAFPHANRQTVAEQDSIGCYMQLLPLRLRVDQSEAQVQDELLAIVQHAEPWALLVQALRPALLPDGSAWASVLLAMHNYPNPMPEFGSLNVSTISVEPEVGQHLLAFEIFPLKDGARLVLSHARDLVTHADADSLLSQWQARLLSHAHSL